MIRIFVKGQELALYRDTTMTVELNNALFASPDVEGDISFTFSLPVEGNERILEFANRAQFANMKEVDCSVYANGHHSWNGKLLLQKSSYNTIQAALVINPYPNGFGDRSLTENHDTEYVISQHLGTHDSAWESFLAASVNDPDIKFAPFINEEGYGSENEDYGHWYGNSRQKIVNTIFFSHANAMIDSDGYPFSKAHNEIFQLDGGEEGDTIYELNQLAFCPQLRIARIMEIWCRNAGYKFINHLGEDLEGTFLQSQKSLDATAAQYGGTSTYFDAWSKVTMSSQYNRYYYLESEDTQHVQNGMLRIDATGWWRFAVDVTFKVANTPDTTAIAFVVMNENAIIDFSSGGVCNRVVVCRKTGTDKYNGHGMFTVYIPAAATNVPIKVMCIRSDGNPVSFMDWTTNTYLEDGGINLEVRKVSSDQKQGGFNIFRSRFRIPELLPDVSNASFLKTMIDTMGLCYFVSGKTKTVELVPYARIRNAKSMDLTEYELTRETETTLQKEAMRTFRLTPIKDEDYNEDLRMPDVDVELPDAYTSHEHLVLRTTTNTLYRASVQEHEDFNWVETWEEHSGNPDSLEVGSGKEEKREPSVKIPHQRLWGHGRGKTDTDIMSGETPQLMVADFTVCSDLYNDSEKPSDIILTQYRGFREREFSNSGQYPRIKNEVMLPVWAGGFSLTAKGANSLGEKYVKPVLELLGHKKVTYKFRLPASMMQAVEDLLRPAAQEPHLQTRYICVRNVRSVPQKISFQIDNDIDDTILCQIEAVKVY